MTNRKFILLLFLLFTLQSQAQFFVPANSYCPMGPEVRLDTVTYMPDKPMPFDRCFFLRLSLPGSPEIKYFTVLPIDQQGNKKVRKRDYEVYIKSNYPGNRKQGKKDMTYGQFKDPGKEFILMFEEIKKVTTDKGTEYVLKIPPLDPNRDYRILLATEDAEQVKNFREITNDILARASTHTVDLKKFDKEQELYNDWLTSNEKKKLRFRSLNFLEFYSLVDDYHNKLYFDRPPVSAAYDSISEKYKNKYPAFFSRYYFYLVKDGTTLAPIDTVNLATDRYLGFITENDPVDLSVPAYLADMQRKQIVDAKSGTAIDFFTAGKYHLYVRVNDLILLGKQFLLDENVVFKDLGTIDISANAGRDKILASFITANPAAPPTQNTGPYYDLFTEAAKLNDTLNKYTDTPFDCLSQKALQDLMAMAVACPCEDKAIRDITQKDDLLKSIAALYHVNVNLLGLRKGIISLSDPFTVVKESNTAGRSANLKNSMAQVRRVKEFIANAGTLVGEEDFKKQLACLSQLEEEMKASLAVLGKRSKLEEEQGDSLVVNLQLYNGQAIANGSAEILDLMGSTKFRIVPDFGLIGVFKGSSGGFQDMTPYLGFQIGFRSIDKNIKMKYVRYKSWRHYLSFTGGITLRSLAIEGKREDFFGNNDLVTGLGFRLNNYFRVTGGAVWFRKIDPNPLITDKPLGFSPFVGLSLDVELQDLFGGLKNLFK